MNDYFKLLEISMDLEGDELRTVINEKRKLWLNRCNSPDLLKRQDAERMLQIIDEAEKVLLDEDKRADYIEELENFQSANIPDRMSLQQYHDKITALSKERKFLEILSLGDIAKNIYPNDTFILIHLGLASYMLSKYEEAIGYYAKAIEISPQDGLIYNEMGNCRYKQCQYFEAAKLFRSALMLNFSDPDLLPLLASSLDKETYQIVNLPPGLPVQGAAIKIGFSEEAIQIMEDLYKQNPSEKKYTKQLQKYYMNKLLVLTEKYMGRTIFFSKQGVFRFQVQTQDKPQIVESSYIWWHGNKKIPSSKEYRLINELINKIYSFSDLDISITKLVDNVCGFLKENVVILNQVVEHVQNNIISPGMVEYAGFKKRLFAAIIDVILVLIISRFLKIFLPLIMFQLNDIISVLTGWIYFAGMECSAYQATVGKIALKIEVTDLDGNRISFVQATIRYFSKLISSLILFIGFIMVEFTEKKQALHDILAGCLVVMKQQD